MPDPCYGTTCGCCADRPGDLLSEPPSRSAFRAAAFSWSWKRNWQTPVHGAEIVARTFNQRTFSDKKQKSERQLISLTVAFSFLAGSLSVYWLDCALPILSTSEGSSSFQNERACLKIFSVHSPKLNPLRKSRAVFSLCKLFQINICRTLQTSLSPSLFKPFSRQSPSQSLSLSLSLSLLLFLSPSLSIHLPPPPQPLLYNPLTSKCPRSKNLST